MRTTLRTYSVALLLASAFALPLTTKAEVNRHRAESIPTLQGFVLATDSCQLAPAEWVGVCPAVVVPIGGQLRLRKRGTFRRFDVTVDQQGNFTEKLEPGIYRVRLMVPQVAERVLKRSAYRIYPQQVRIQAAARGSVRASSQPHLFLVAHKTRGVPASVGISDGFNKG